MFRFIPVLFLFFLTHLVHASGMTEKQAINLYLEKNLEVMALKFDINIAEAEALTAGLWANPTILIDTQLNSLGKNWNSKSTGGPTQQDYIATIPIDVNGKRRQAVRVAKLAIKVKESEFQAIMREGLFNMLSTLYNIQRLKREYELMQEKLQLLERLVHTLEKRIGNSRAQPLIQSRARLAYEDLKVEIEKNKIEQTAEMNRLKVFLHQETPEDILPLVTFRGEVQDKLNAQELVEHAKKHRPDFRAIEILKQQLEGQQDLDHRRIWDDVGLQAGFSRQRSIGALEGAWSWMVGVVVPIPVFDRNQGEILQTKIRTNQALVREKFMLETISRDIESSIRKIEITGLNLSRYKSGQLTNAKLVRDSALRQFGTGATSLLEYLDAMDAYHSSIQKYIAAEFDLTTEYLKLKLISGQEIGP